MKNQGKSTRDVLIGLAAVMVAVTAVLVIRSRTTGVAAPTPAPISREGTDASHGAAAPTAPVSSTGTAPVASAAGSKPVEAKAPTAPADGSSSGYGAIPAINAEGNPHLAKVMEAITTGKHPERLSALITPAPFSKSDWEKDPAAYLAVTEPGRAFQPAQPEPGTPRLRFSSSAGVVIAQGDASELAVQAPPGAPVSWLILHGGVFDENTLPAATVRAGTDGIARVHYRSTPGVIEQCDVVVACPLAVGQLRFRIFVTDQNHPFIASQPASAEATALVAPTSDAK